MAHERMIAALRGPDGRVPPERFDELDALIRELGRERMREAFGGGPVYGFHGSV